MKNDSNNYTSLVNSLVTLKLHEQFNKGNNIFTSVEQSRPKNKKRVTSNTDNYFYFLAICLILKEENLNQDLVLSMAEKLSGNLLETKQIMNSWWNNKWFSRLASNNNKYNI